MLHRLSHGTVTMLTSVVTRAVLPIDLVARRIVVRFKVIPSALSGGEE
jgi:hypothetical protein